MKKIKVLICLCMALTILCGSAITAFAENEKNDNYVEIHSGYKGANDEEWMHRTIVFNPEDNNVELVAVKSPIKSGETLVGESYSFYVVGWESGQFDGGMDFAKNCPYFKYTRLNTDGSTVSVNMTDIEYKGYLPDTWYDITFSVTKGSFKVFENTEAIMQYAKDKTGEYELITQPALDKSFYLKNIQYLVRAEDSSEYEDLTFIKFAWDTDNLKEGDLLEIKTKNHYTKIGGDQIIGFHDFITSNNGVSCYEGSYEMSQTDAVKAWFATIDNKPLMFKDYDTDIYYLRPVRGNQYGAWVKVTMGRKTPISSPFISDIEYGDLTEDGDWVVDENITISQGGNHGIDQNGNILTDNELSKIVELDNLGDWLSYLFSCIKQLFGYFGELPTLISTVAGWLPNPIIVIICASILVVILLRIFGR